MKKQRILIVDDGVENLHLLGKILGREHEILTALSGEEGLRVALAQNPDLILLDILMPGMDGYEVLRRLKGAPSTANIPLMFISGISSEAEEARGLEAGAVDYIVKPIHPAIVRARVRNHLELKRHRDFLEGLSAKDGLTGIANRRRFDEYVGAEFLRAMRNGSSLSLLMMDIDSFKIYNDRFGHQAGDDALRCLAETLTGCLHRPADLVARFGGEEFACILPATDASGAIHVAKRIIRETRKIRPQCESVELTTAGPSDGITVSIGIATVKASQGVNGHPFSPESLIREADQRLYRAKALGKNRICCAANPAEKVSPETRPKAHSGPVKK